MRRLDFSDVVFRCANVKIRRGTFGASLSCFLFLSANFDTQRIESAQEKSFIFRRNEEGIPSLRIPNGTPKES